MNIAEDKVWYHGSNMMFDILKTGSSITPWEDIAEAFSHTPTKLDLSDDGVIHNGTASGYLYIVDEQIAIGTDAIIEKTTNDEEGLEYITTRPLHVKMICSTGLPGLKKAKDNDKLLTKIYQECGIDG